jgi:hypothetical protein
MAFVNIQNARVDRIIKDKGFVAVESYKTRNGEDKQSNYTVWTTNPNDIPGEGVVVNVSGPLSVKLREFENDEGETVRFASVNVNQPKITLVDMPAEAPESATNPVTASWDAPF